MAVWFVVGAVLVSAAISIMVVVLRRRANRGATDEAAAARLVIQEMAKERSRRSKGSLRGKGEGGDRNTAYDAAYGSDTSSGA